VRTGPPHPGLAQWPAEKEEAAGHSGGLFAFDASNALGQVVADVAEDVLELAAKEDHGDDDRDGDDGNDECVLDEPLAFVVTNELEHLLTSF
jgi:hypothetical protein